MNSFLEPQSCPNEHEEFKCSEPCEKHCQHYNGTKCDENQPRICAYRCACKVGYLRISPNKCIPADSAECGGPYNYNVPNSQKPRGSNRKGGVVHYPETVEHGRKFTRAKVCKV